MFYLLRGPKSGGGVRRVWAKSPNINVFLFEASPYVICKNVFINFYKTKLYTIYIYQRGHMKDEKLTIEDVKKSKKGSKFIILLLNFKAVFYNIVLLIYVFENIN